jgi:hypothetical protein
MTDGLSTRFFTLAVLLLTGLGACVDAEAKFDEFDERVPDAGIIDEPDAEPLDVIPNITGHFLVALSPVVAPDARILYIATTDMTPTTSGGVVDIQALTALDRDTFDPVPDTDPLASMGNEVNLAGQFEAPVRGDVPGRANPLSGQPLIIDVTLLGTIVDEDLWCGIANGVETTLNIDLNGSTFGAIRIPEGTTGDALPDPLAACPDDGGDE